MSNTEKGIDIATVTEQLQIDCHHVVENIMQDKKISYQDATNVWLFMKLAEIEIRLNQLENKS